MEYRVGEFLVHEGSGVCQITDIDDMELMGKGSRKTYYCMTPVYKAGAKVFTPVDGSTAKLRNVASVEEFKYILENMNDISIIQEDNDRARQEKIKEIMGEFTPKSTASVVKTVLLRKWARIAAGKKVMAQDEKVLSVAGKKLYEEMAFSMKKELSEVQELFEASVKACEEYASLI